MSALSLVMPMAGRGSRFARDGINLPKPLIPLDGKPFFWWATESVLRTHSVREMVFVVLDEHRERYAIDQRIHHYYPQARIVSIPDVTSGAAETAAIGIAALQANGPFAVNDCDQAFVAPKLATIVEQLGTGADGALLCFTASSANFSYAEVDEAGHVRNTVEKKVVSPFAIAGCYLFSSPQAFDVAFEHYRETCEYDELFISGLVNAMLSDSRLILKTDLDYHVTFGTPEELAAVDLAALRERFAAPGNAA